MESDLSLEFLRVTEQAAIACAHTMGQGDRHGSDQVAVEAMRRALQAAWVPNIDPVRTIRIIVRPTDSLNLVHSYSVRLQAPRRANSRASLSALRGFVLLARSGANLYFLRTA